MRLNIGELLLQESLITSHQLQEAMAHWGRHGGTLSRALVRLGFVKDRDIASLLSVHCCVPTIDIEDFEVSPAIARILPVEKARKHQALPLARLGATLAIATADPTNAAALDDIRLLTGYNLEPFVAAESALEAAIERSYGGRSPAEMRGDTSTGGDGEEAKDRPLPLGIDFDGLVDIDLGALQGSAVQDQGGGAEARAQSERTAWAYVTAMHAAAVGGPRTPIRGIVEDVEDMRATLIRERDDARDRVASLERQLDRRKWWRQFWCATYQRAGVERVRSPLAAAWRLVAGAIGPPVAAAPDACANRGSGSREPLSADDQEFIEEHLAEGRVYVRYGLVDKARAQFETVLERSPENSDALVELRNLAGEKRDDGVAVQRLAAMAATLPEAKAPAKARTTLAELLMEQGLVSLEQCLEALRDQKRNGGDLGAALVRLGFVKDEEILAVVSVAYGIPSIRLDHFDVHPAVLEVLAPDTARKHQVLPLAVSSTLTLAVADPSGRGRDQEAGETVPRGTVAPRPPRPFCLRYMC